ncbi:MAG: choice-of-anchor Q domain-containing protein [Pseudomonadales bacterium]
MNNIIVRQIRFMKSLLTIASILVLAGCKINVTTTEDAEDANLHDGICHIYSGTPPASPQDRVCSLRAAIAQAQYNVEDSLVIHQVIVPRGTYQLSLEEPLALNSAGIIIQGAVTDRTIIDANYKHPVFATENRSKIQVKLTQLHLSKGVPRGDGPSVLNVGGGSVDLDQIEFSGNQGPLLFVGGGATLTGSQVYMHGNRGGIVNWGRLDLVDSSITDNILNRWAPVSNQRGQLKLTNVTISGNRATDQGRSSFGSTIPVEAASAVLLGRNSRAELNNVTIAYNSLTINGRLSINSHAAGLITVGDGASTVTNIRNSIITENSVTTRWRWGGFSIKNCSGRVSSLSHSLVGISSTPAHVACDVQQSSNNIYVDTVGPPAARLGRLALNQGSIPTHSLLPDSPALDSGAPNRGGCATRDQRGVPRPQTLGVNQDNARCDMGAFEAGNHASKVIEFRLVDTANNMERVIRTGDLLLAEDLPENYTIRAITTGSPGNVNFDLLGNNIQTTFDDRRAPFALTRELENGEYTLRATPYAQPGFPRSAGGVSKSITFSVFRE